MKTCESKDLNWQHDKQELYYNVMFAKSMNTINAQHPSLGTGNSNSIWDKINVGGYMLHMFKLLGQKVDGPNMSFQYAIVEVLRGATYMNNNLFENATGNMLLDQWNKDYTSLEDVAKGYKSFTKK